MSDFEQGKPPKSKDSIRASLDALRKPEGDSSIKRSGPMKDGFAADFQITAGTFRDGDNARRYQNLLTRDGVYSKLHISRHGSLVTVDAEDSQKAAELYQIHKREHPDLIPLGNARRFDYLIFGGMISATFGIVLIGAEFDHPMTYLVFATFIAIGLSMGHLFDRLKTRFKKTGSFRIGVWEFLILATLPALFALLFSFLPKILMGA